MARMQDIKASVREYNLLSFGLEPVCFLFKGFEIFYFVSIGFHNQPGVQNYTGSIRLIDFIRSIRLTPRPLNLEPHLYPGSTGENGAINVIGAGPSKCSGTFVEGVSSCCNIVNEDNSSPLDPLRVC